MLLAITRFLTMRFATNLIVSNLFNLPLNQENSDSESSSSYEQNYYTDVKNNEESEYDSSTESYYESSTATYEEAYETDTSSTYEYGYDYTSTVEAEESRQTEYSYEDNEVSFDFLLFVCTT